MHYNAFVLLLLLIRPFKCLQFRCKPNIVGRSCDHCRSGHWSFPNCYLCDCDYRGTTSDICDQVRRLCEQTLAKPRMPKTDLELVFLPYFVSDRILPNVSVNLTFTVKRVICAKMARLTYKKRTTKDVRNVSVSAKPPAVRVRTFTELRCVCVCVCVIAKRAGCS